MVELPSSNIYWEEERHLRQEVKRDIIKHNCPPTVLKQFIDVLKFELRNSNPVLAKQRWTIQSIIDWGLICKFQKFRNCDYLTCAGMFTFLWTKKKKKKNSLLSQSITTYKVKKIVNLKYMTLTFKDSRPMSTHFSGSD